MCLDLYIYCMHEERERRVCRLWGSCMSDKVTTDNRILWVERVRIWSPSFYGDGNSVYRVWGSLSSSRFGHHRESRVEDRRKVGGLSAEPRGTLPVSQVERERDWTTLETNRKANSTLSFSIRLSKQNREISRWVELFVQEMKRMPTACRQ